MLFSILPKKNNETHTPSQSAPTIENMGQFVTLKKIRSKIWTWKNQGEKNRVIVIQKEKRQHGLFSMFLYTLLFFRSIFWTWFFSGSQTDPCFQNKNSGCRLTGQLKEKEIMLLVNRELLCACHQEKMATDNLQMRKILSHMPMRG